GLSPPPRRLRAVAPRSLRPARISRTRFPESPARREPGIARRNRAAARDAADAISDRGSVSADDIDALERNLQHIGGNLRVGRAMALAGAAGAGGDAYTPRRQQGERGAFERSHPGAFHIHGEADAQKATLPRRRGLS